MPAEKEKHHHHHGLKHIFKKEHSPESPTDSGKESVHGSHIGLSKLFHHGGESKADTPSGSSGGRISRTPSVLSMRRHSSNMARSHSNIENEKTPKKLSKAETMAHLQQMNKNNAARSVRQTNELRSGTPGGGVRGGGLTITTNVNNNLQHEKIKYNPFGLNKSPSAEHPSTSFYLSGGPDTNRVLNNPVADPNDFLPDELQQEHVNLLEDFEIDMQNKKLGDGGSSDVRIINSACNRKNVYALKKFTLLDKESDDDFYKRAIKEYIISKKASHSRHVVDTIMMVRIQSQANLTRGWGIILELCGGGDLFNAIVKLGWKSSSLNEKYCIFKQIAYGVKFLHEMGIAHKDLKPENVLIDDKGIAKLCDFGVSAYGNEIEGDLSSPVKLSTAYVGSPPYSPPEVMKLREMGSSDKKKWAYDPYKMDCWALGMLLFCVVYRGVPFSTASPNDHAYREYSFNHSRYAGDHPNFKHNLEVTKGPGSEFKWAQQFHSTGAARVAWKLCDPSVTNRYTLDLLFADPWFTELEMCIYEHPDQDVNPVITPPGSSNPSSGQTSRAPSRKATIGSNYDSDEFHASFRSMLDLGGQSNETSPNVNQNSKFNHEYDYRDKDDSSIHSSSSITQTPLKLHRGDRTNSYDRMDNHEAFEGMDNDTSSEYSNSKPRSMLDVSNDDPTFKDSQQPSSANLPALKEDEIETFDNMNKPQENMSTTSSILSATRKSSGDHPVPNENEKHENGVTKKKSLPELHVRPLKCSSQLHIDSNGVCELGYKIKKHHHVGLSNVTVSGSLSRKR